MHRATEKPRLKRQLRGQRQSGLEAEQKMTSWMTRALGVAMISMTGFAALTPAAMAQESTNQVAAMTDWSVFADKNPSECWGVSAPKETVNTKDGKPASVRRGDIRLYITFRPGSKPEISFAGGYPFAPGSTVNLNVEGTEFELFTDGEWAWPGPTEDDVIMAALKKGTSAVLTARSAKGTQTKDTFSLRGFTAAMDEAAKQCAN